MPRTIILPTDIEAQESVGLLYADADAVDNMMFINDGSCVLIVRNNGIVPVEVTIVAVPDEAGRQVDYVKSVVADTTEVFGTFLPAWWNQTITNFGFVYVDFDVDTDVQVALINF